MKVHRSLSVSASDVCDGHDITVTIGGFGISFVEMMVAPSTITRTLGRLSLKQLRVIKDVIERALDEYDKEGGA